MGCYVCNNERAELKELGGRDGKAIYFDDGVEVFSICQYCVADIVRWVVGKYKEEKEGV